MPSTSTAPAASTLDTAEQIIRLGNRFSDAKALLTAVELDVFGVLRENPGTAEEIRERLDVAGRGLPDMLHLLTALGLLDHVDGRFHNSPSAAKYLIRGTDDYIGGFLQRSNRNLYPAWGKLTEALRTGRPQAVGNFDLVVADPRLLRQFIGMMDGLTQVLGPQLVAAYDFAPHGTVLDVGGCRGNLLSKVLGANPGLTGTVFDLPQMEPFFDELMAETGLTGRATFHGGNFFEDPLPRANLVNLGHVLHDWDPGQRKELVAKAYAAVEPGGSLLIYDRMLDDEPEHVENLVISLDMLLVTDGGSEYTVTEVKDHATAAGCRDITEQPLGAYDTLVICRKP
ncbi:methyltransferase [Amycolatopsis regifaucium]|uniref:Methyltransferase n=1 Tax=Amycolatopsis regifaucium TaxID=546365 RepID=A0A154MWG5_9PSEU|nr:methyltransferase [Amycolatopsis regifaucium]KZB88340.1 methyltransferase [Amycolatopsis regifaucium]OKA11451.1 methyltransferase [Amycolatopsis regifaucium]SFH41464.1 Dimerisation domain-containing protein [Amycolatopsis regifaucium]